MSKSVKDYQVKIHQEAIDELDQIYRFIFSNAPSRAGSFLKALKKKMLSLKKFPRRGSCSSLLQDQQSPQEIRFLEYKKYLIFYKVEEKIVTVLHVATPGQNWIDFFINQ